MVDQRYDILEGWNAIGTWEEYRYDALGRRVLVHALRDSLCTSAGPTGTCANFDQFTVWDGDHVLAEQRSSSSGGSATSGTVVYLHSGALDRPLEILDTRTGMDGRVPIYDWRGLGQASRWTNGTAADCTLMTGPCTTVSWPAGEGVYYKRPVPQVNGPLPTWLGSLLANGEDGTGLLYRRNRYYDPASGRFTQEDPIGIAGGLNLYGFASGDPVNFSDPFGLCEPWPECWIRAAQLVARNHAYGWNDLTTEEQVFLLIGGPGTLSRRVSTHHIATIENRISTRGGGPWTQKFEALFEKAGMSLGDDLNKVLVRGHRGPHAAANAFTYDRLISATEGLTGDAYTAAFKAELAKLREEAATAGTELNRLLTKAVE